MTDASEYMMADGVPPLDAYQEAASRRQATIPDIVVDQGLPANLDAEKTILAAILLDNAAFNDAAERLEPDDFSLDSHRRIFQRMSELMDANHAVDIVTLANELARWKEIESVGGVAYLASLTEGVPRRMAIDEYIRIVKDKSQLRKLMLVCSAAIARAAEQSDTALSVLEDAESRLLEIAQEANVGKLRTIADSVEVVGGVDEYLAPIFSPVAKTGLMTGFYDYDDMTGGLQKGELTIWAARPSQGKTGLLTCALTNICIGNEAVGALFSLEMARQQIETRILAARAFVDVQRALSGKFLSEGEKTKLRKALGDLVDSKLFIDDSAALTPTQMRAKARRLKQRHGRLDVVGVDYVQLMSAPQRHQNRQEEVAAISRSLKQMAKELECPVIALAQLSRKNEERSDKRPILSDLRESGQIEQDADVVAFIHRDSYYNRDEEMSERDRAMTEIIIGKSRNGPTGIVRLLFMASVVKFENMAIER